MLIFFDTEFTGLVPYTTLISIGCVAEDGRKFYGEFTDNVINHLAYKKTSSAGIWTEEKTELAIKLGKDPLVTFVRGDSDKIRNALKMWLSQFGVTEMTKDGLPIWRHDQIQFVSDVCHYDFTLLCNLFGGVFNLPKNVNPVYYDICQDLCARAEDENGKLLPYADMKYMNEAFDVSREAVCNSICGSLPEGEKHNALYDAEVIKMIYEGMRKNSQK